MLGSVQRTEWDNFLPSLSSGKKLPTELVMKSGKGCCLGRMTRDSVGEEGGNRTISWGWLDHSMLSTTCLYKFQKEREETRLVH